MPATSSSRQAGLTLLLIFFLLNVNSSVPFEKVDFNTLVAASAGKSTIS
jgi:hypothetical protein